MSAKKPNAFFVGNFDPFTQTMILVFGGIAVVLVMVGIGAVATAIIEATNLFLGLGFAVVCCVPLSLGLAYAVSKHAKP